MQILISFDVSQEVAEPLAKQLWTYFKSTECECKGEITTFPAALQKTGNTLQLCQRMNIRLQVLGVRPISTSPTDVTGSLMKLQNTIFNAMEVMKQRISQ